MTSTTGWRTGRRAKACAGCEREFAPHAAVVSALFDGAAEESTAADVAAAGNDAAAAPDAAASAAPDDDVPAFVRRDLCDDCFGPRQDGAFSWWRTEVPEPEAKKAALDLDVAREFLRRLLAETDENAAEERAPLRYLLALLLMRKRIVRVHEQFKDERGEIMVIRIPPSEDVHEITCPELGEEETESLRDQLGALFDLGDGPGDDGAERTP